MDAIRRSQSIQAKIILELVGQIDWKRKLSVTCVDTFAFVHSFASALIHPIGPAFTLTVAYIDRTRPLLPAPSLPSLASRGWLPGRPERRREGIIIFIIDQYLEMLGIDTHCTQLSTYSHIHASAIICYRHIQCDWDGEIDYACEQMGRAHLT